MLSYSDDSGSTQDGWGIRQGLEYHNACFNTELLEE